MSKKTEWEKEFDKLIKLMRLEKNKDVWIEVKSLISDLLAKEKMELVERIERELPDYELVEYDQEGKQYNRTNHLVMSDVMAILSALKSEEKEEVGEE